MFNPLTKEIQLTRGDDWEHALSFSDDSGPLPFIAGDLVKFTVRRNFDSTEKLIQKTFSTFTDGYAVIHLSPADTSALPFGDYVYDIETTTSYFGVFTAVKGRLYLDYEATY